MDRIPVLVLLAAFYVLATPLAANAQSANAYRIGFLSPASSSSMASRVAAFNGGLRELGYLEGQNITTEFRWGDGKDVNLAKLAAELIEYKLDVLVVHGAAAAQAARKVSSTVPIVCYACGDVLGTGLASSLARPGGNITGITTVAPDVTGKRLQLLQQVVPKLARLGVLWNRDNPVPQELKETETAARSLGIEVQLAGIRHADDLQAIVSSMTKSRVDALIVLSDAMLYGQRNQIAALAIANQLPAVSWTGEFAKAGGLMAYGPDVLALARRASGYVDKILKGAKPADLPIEQPTKFDLVINLKTAKALGLTIPQSLRLQAELID
jgi:putative tryptophan/tyrosine transport system substrate-binding protein